MAKKEVKGRKRFNLKKVSDKIFLLLKILCIVSIIITPIYLISSWCLSKLLNIEQNWLMVTDGILLIVLSLMLLICIAIKDKIPFIKPTFEDIWLNLFLCAFLVFFTLVFFVLIVHDLTIIF